MRTCRNSLNRETSIVDWASAVLAVVTSSKDIGEISIPFHLNLEEMANTFRAFDRVARKDGRYLQEFKNAPY